METTEVVARAQAYRKAVQAAQTKADAKAIAVEFHGYYDALNAEQRKEADGFLKQVVEEHRLEMEEIERMLKALELKRNGAVAYEEQAGK